MNVGIRAPYIRVVGIQVDTDGPGRSTNTPITPEEEDEFRRLAASPTVYDTLSRSVAPSIYGSLDMKKAITLLLFGGSRKRLPDGTTRRGDINLLMLGDPGTAKSQLLKFVEQAAPIGVSMWVIDSTGVSMWVVDSTGVSMWVVDIIGVSMWDIDSTGVSMWVIDSTDSVCGS